MKKEKKRKKIKKEIKKRKNGVKKKRHLVEENGVLPLTSTVKKHAPLFPAVSSAI